MSGGALNYLSAFWGSKDSRSYFVKRAKYVRLAAKVLCGEDSCNIHWDHSGVEPIVREKAIKAAGMLLKMLEHETSETFILGVADALEDSELIRTLEWAMSGDGSMNDFLEALDDFFNHTSLRNAVGDSCE